MKKLSLFILAILLIVSFAFAEVFRQGDPRITYQHLIQDTYTSDQTLTSSNDLVNVTCSTADITIILPAISSFDGSSKSYKILKTDATSYAVIVTPATGNTIGGESTRYIFGQNDYIVITAPSGGSTTNWLVDFESPYIVEDYEAGTVTNIAVSKRRSEAVASPDGDTTLTAADCGEVQFIGAAGDDFTLPLPTAGCRILFIVDSAWATTAVTIITNGSSNIMYGITTEAETDTGDDGPPASGNDTLTLSQSLETVGDWVEFIGNGTNWYVRGVAKLDGAFAFSTAS